MQSENQKTRNKNVNSKSNILFFIFSLLAVIAITATLVIIYFTLKDLNMSSETDNLKNRDYLLAEEYFNKGYLEDSEKYYRLFLSSNPDKFHKINTYQKLFEISVISGKTDKALANLNEWQSVDRKNPKIFINRLKLLLRTGKLSSVHDEINKNYSKMKQFSEYREIVGIYHIKAGSYRNALKEFLGIPFNKREFTLHENIVFCYLKTKDIKSATQYLKKIESKITALGSRENNSSLVILKSIALILGGDIDKASEQLEAQGFSEKYKSLSLKLAVYCDMILDRHDKLTTLIENNESDIKIDADFASIIGDYYIYKSDYANALYFYEKISGFRKMTQSEMMTLADIYYKTGNYEKSIEVIQRLYKDYNYRSSLVYKNLSMNYKKLSDDKNEYFYLNEGLNFYPEDTDFYVMIAKNFLDNGDTGKAIDVIDEGLNVVRGKDLEFDRRLELLKITAMERDKKHSIENELLLLRETGNNTPEYYFKIIEKYLKEKKLTDAKREIDTVVQLPLSDTQKDMLNVYKLVYYSYGSDVKEYEKIKKLILSVKPVTDERKINVAVIRIKDGEYDDALDILNAIETGDDDYEMKERVSYLKAVAYYFKRNYPASYKQLLNIKESGELSKKSSYLKSIINQYGE